ncbi:MAG TPA: acetyl-CoA C-acetyltransferase [Gammaproteobacteria bacterium]|nr:acetyl-CoA C-acetyltransferase [Gammaproteobacteria bacterium]
MAENSPRRVAIIGGLRIPFCRSRTRYAECSNQDMATAALKALVERYHLQGQRLGDVAIGAVIKKAVDWNLARETVLGTSLSPQTPGYDLQRACGTSLSATLQIGHKIALGEIEVGVGGGTDTVSDVPIVYSDRLRKILLRAARAKTFGDKLKAWSTFRPGDLKPAFPGVVEPRTGLSMGEHCELMAKTWQLTQQEQDELALASHQKAAAAWKEGFYDDLVVPFNGADRDNNIRPDTSMEKLAALKPVFDRSSRGTLTAGNSTPLTDGAAMVLLASEAWAQSHGLTPLAYLTYGEVAAVDYVDGAEGLLMAPAYAVPRMLDRAGLTLQDFDFYEIHEAFAAQVLCLFKAWESEKFCREKLGRDRPLGSIDQTKLNVKGGSVALGHPFAATGARIVATLAKLLAERGSGRGLISICTAGGMGVSAILERP